MPGYLLANVPAVLGFYPQDSLVLVGLDRHRGNTYHMGPVLRADYPLPPEALAEGLDTVAGAGSTSVMVFLIGAVPSDSAVRSLREEVQHPALRLWGGWWCERIVTGERYGCLWEEEHGRWPGGVIPAVSQTPAMQALVECGELPELTRAEACAHFQVRGKPWFVDHQDAYRLVHTMRHTPGLRKEVEAEAEDLLRGNGDTTHLAILLSHHMLRDLLIPPVLEHPEQAYCTLRRVVHHTRGEARANALCLHAVAAAACGRPWRAALALHTAVEEAPGHTLGRLLHAVCSQRGTEAMLCAVRESSEASGRSNIPGSTDSG
ncbi:MULTISPECIES: DUF4192 domain-containing protein [unclassified Corynebacterium]|uniref:DUF4192 domain-containing protein n=1 Tax=unclassified Corynebacterium TaxID=2624378 RepID=UPI0029CAA43C|nr:MULTISPECIES: DUF4192 domain-containing protein [unclassified Corynebacterium]WPF65243.1 DUF4192 domain-containing protein [Corynebacterium sp. 22KM0430]WPF67738.1 DUF4192 domain-containing protein [Corynebacterium sp. 21KM1197]